MPWVTLRKIDGFQLIFLAVSEVDYYSFEIKTTEKSLS